MKQVWTFLVIFVMTLVPMPNEAWAQTGFGTAETYRIDSIWPYPSTNINFRSLAFNKRNSNLFAIVLGDTNGQINWTGNVFRTADSGKTWVRLPRPYKWGFFWTVYVTESGNVLVGTDEGVSKSTDNGNTWRHIKIPDDDFPRISALLETNDGTLFAGGDIICRSTDRGETWVQVADTNIVRWYVNCLTITPFGTILAGLGSGIEGTAKGILRSTDNGDSWHYSGLDGKHITGLTSPRTGFSKLVFANTELGGAFWSEDEGESWKPILSLPTGRWGGPIALFTTGLFVGYGYNSNIKEAVYRSVDRGYSWTKFAIDDVLSFVELGVSKIGVGTASGAYAISFSNPTKVEDPAIPTVYSLSQNYPNPFNPSTTIEFQLPHRDFVKLSVSNIIGQEVAVLVNEEKGAGTHRVVWNAGVLPSGIYFYRLETTSGFVAAKKMLLVK